MMVWYAWYPVKTLSGKWIWLETVNRLFNEFLNPWADANGYSGYDGGYEYTELP